MNPTARLLLGIAAATLFVGCAAGVADRTEDRYDRQEDRYDRRHYSGPGDHAESRYDRAENRYDKVRGRRIY